MPITTVEKYSRCSGIIDKHPQYILKNIIILFSRGVIFIPISNIFLYQM